MMNPEAAAVPAHEAVSLGQKIAESLHIRIVFNAHLFGFTIPVSETVVISWVAMAILIVFSFFATRNMKEVPRGLQSYAEMFVEFIGKFCKDNIGHDGAKFMPFIGTVALFLVTVNLLPMISPVGGFGFEPFFRIAPPAKDINFTAAFGMTTIVIVLVAAIIKRGFVGWLKTLISPVPFMLPFKLLEYIVRPVSLSLRLFGNILGAFILMQLVETLLPVGLPPIVGL